MRQSPLAKRAKTRRFSGNSVSDTDRLLPTECAVALSFNGTTEAVMMATPGDLVDFAIGFALTEGIISTIEDISELNVVTLENGFDVQMNLAADCEAALKRRRRTAAGPVGCGLCGIESIEAALRQLPRLANTAFVMTAADIDAAVSALSDYQPLRNKVGAVHGAGFWRREGGLVTVREDVGRHNALDKLVGALTRDKVAISEGALVISSRVSVDMVQKAVLAGALILIAVSAPTDLAVQTGYAAGLTLVALARGQEFEVYCHPERISGLSAPDPEMQRIHRETRADVT